MDANPWWKKTQKGSSQAHHPIYIELYSNFARTWCVAIATQMLAKGQAIGLHANVGHGIPTAVIDALKQCMNDFGALCWHGVTPLTLDTLLLLPLRQRVNANKKVLSRSRNVRDTNAAPRARCGSNLRSNR